MQYASICMCMHGSESVQAYKDPMHDYDQGVAINICKVIVKEIHELEDVLGLSRNTLVNKLTLRLYMVK